MIILTIQRAWNVREGDFFAAPLHRGSRALPLWEAFLIAPDERVED